MKLWSLDARSLRTHLPTPFNGRWEGREEKRREKESAYPMCSRNARPRKALVGRVHIEMDHADSKK